jgi:hypothetical protein
MKTLMLFVLVVALVSFIGCEKKNSVSLTGPSGETASITVK